MASDPITLLCIKNVNSGFSLVNNFEWIDISFRLYQPNLDFDLVYTVVPNYETEVKKNLIWGVLNFRATGVLYNFVSEERLRMHIQSQDKFLALNFCFIIGYLPL